MMEIDEPALESPDRRAKNAAASNAITTATLVTAHNRRRLGADERPEIRPNRAV
jgi:hypothetical protein